MDGGHEHESCPYHPLHVDSSVLWAGSVNPGFGTFCVCVILFLAGARGVNAGNNV